MVTSIEQFLSDIENFLKRTGMRPTTFSKGAIGDPNFVSDIRAGRMPNLGLVKRVYDFIASQEESAQ